MTLAKKIIRELVTGKDNQTQDLGRWSWVISMFAVIGAGVSNAIHTGVVDLVALAQALGTVVGAHGLALWAKKDTEPSDATDSK